MGIFSVLFYRSFVPGRIGAPKSRIEAAILRYAASTSSVATQDERE